MCYVHIISYVVHLATCEIMFEKFSRFKRTYELREKVRELRRKRYFNVQKVPYLQLVSMFCVMSNVTFELSIPVFYVRILGTNEAFE